jgi:hypothetical protein
MVRAWRFIGPPDLLQANGCGREWAIGLRHCAHRRWT